MNSLSSLKSSLSVLALSAGLIVSASSLYQSHESQRDSCQALQRQALAAALAPIEANAANRLGFTPMSQFDKAFPPVCPPANTEADVFSSLVAGAIVALGFYCIGLVFRRFNHKE